MIKNEIKKLLTLKKRVKKLMMQYRQCRKRTKNSNLIRDNRRRSQWLYNQLDIFDAEIGKRLLYLNPIEGWEPSKMRNITHLEEKCHDWENAFAMYAYDLISGADYPVTLATKPRQIFVMRGVIRGKK